MLLIQRRRLGTFLAEHLDGRSIEQVHTALVDRGVDVTYSTVWSWFQPGRRLPRLQHFAHLCDVLELDAGETCAALRLLIRRGAPETTTTKPKKTESVAVATSTEDPDGGASSPSGEVRADPGDAPAGDARRDARPVAPSPATEPMSRPALTTADLDRLQRGGCQAPGCTDPHDGPFALTGRCHPEAGVCVEYVGVRRRSASPGAHSGRTGTAPAAPSPARRALARVRWFFARLQRSQQAWQWDGRLVGPRQRLRRLAQDAADVERALLEALPELACRCGPEPDPTCVLHGQDCTVCGAFPGEPCTCDADNAAGVTHHTTPGASS